MKQSMFLFLIILSFASCTRPGDPATTIGRADSSTNSSLNDSSATLNAPNGINGDTGMQYKGVSNGAADSTGTSRLNAPASNTLDTAKNPKR